LQEPQKLHILLAAQSPGEEGLCFADAYLFIYFSVISVSPIISTSTGPIFTEFAVMVKVWL